MAQRITKESRKKLIEKKTEKFRQSKIQRLNAFQNWWENTVHGNYIKDQQFDRIVQNM